MTCPGSPTKRSVSTLPSHGTNVARTGRLVASGVMGDPMSTYFGPATTHASCPTTASVSASGAGSARRDRIATRHGHADRAGRRARRLTRAGPGPESPRNPSPFECSIRGAESNGIERSRDQRGERRHLVGADDGDVVPVDDTLGGAQHVERILHERTRCGRDGDARRCSDPNRKVPDVVARELVRLELHGARQPTALRRRRSHHDFLIRRGSAARERAAAEHDAIRRRVARQKARRDRAARRPSHRTRFGEHHGAVPWRRHGGRVEQNLRVGDRRRVLPFAALAVGEQRDLARVQPTARTTPAARVNAAAASPAPAVGSSRSISSRSAPASRRARDRRS